MFWHRFIYYLHGSYIYNYLKGILKCVRYLPSPSKLRWLAKLYILPHTVNGSLLYREPQLSFFWLSATGKETKTIMISIYLASIVEKKKTPTTCINYILYSLHIWSGCYYQHHFIVIITDYYCRDSGIIWNLSMPGIVQSAGYLSLHPYTHLTAVNQSQSHGSSERVSCLWSGRQYVLKWRWRWKVEHCDLSYGWNFSFLAQTSRSFYSFQCGFHIAHVGAIFFFWRNASTTYFILTRSYEKLTFITDSILNLFFTSFTK